MARRQRKCPSCGVGVLPIVYGFPTPETFEAAERGEVILGGCTVGGYEPEWRCPACGRVGGSLGWREDDLPYSVLLRNAAGVRPHTKSPRAWSEFGLNRMTVQRGGLVQPDLPLLVRGYVSEESGWQELDDDPDGRFGLGATVLREDGSEPRPLDLGDLVMYLGEVSGCDTPMLWAPALIVRLAAIPPRRRTAWTLSDADIRSRDGDECVALWSLDVYVQQVVREVVMAGSPATTEQRYLLLDIFGQGAQGLGVASPDVPER